MYDIISKGSNTLGSKDTFFWRRYYDALVSPMAYDGVLPIDIRNERPLYGRVNGNGDPVYVIPKEDYYRNLISSKNRPVRLLNFVADAFEELQEEMNLKIAKGELSRHSKFTNLTAEYGLMNVQHYYNNYLDVLYHRFTGKYLESHWAMAKKVRSFESYMRVFLEFIRREAHRLPFTRTAFLSGNMVPPTISGLCIETHDVDFSEDFNKHHIYINDNNYEAYRVLARKYGFMIDRHAPWRLVADVTSPYMNKKMFKYGLSSSNVFSKYFVPSYVYDIDVMRVVLFNWYNQYVTSYPNYRQVKITQCKSAIRRNATDSKQIVAKYTPRERFENIEEYDSRFGANYWLRQYVFIRFSELSIPLGGNTFKKVMKKVLTIHRVKGYHNAVRYINQTTKKRQPNKVYTELLDTVAGVSSTLRVRHLKRTPQKPYTQLEKKTAPCPSGFTPAVCAGKKPKKTKTVNDTMKTY